MSKRGIAAAAVALVVPLTASACASAESPSSASASVNTPSVGATNVGVSRNAPDKAKAKAKKAGPITLDGAGASSIEPFFESVFYSYHKAFPRVTINYNPAGSSVGVTDIEQRTVDFGDSEIPMAAKDLAKAKGTVLQVPVDLGGVAVSYNVPGAKGGLRFDGPLLEAIFDGTITNWDNPAIAQETGDKNLPNLAIVPVHRADTSGPGWDLDQYLIVTSPSWRAVTHTSTPSKAWPLPDVGVGEQLNSGVATYIAQTQGAIGYVEYGYALKAGFTNAALQNAAGNYITPTEDSIAQAGHFANNLSATNFDIVDKPGKTTYPLANFSWTLLYQKQSNLAKAKAIKALFNYVITTGQIAASSLGYAPLPANAVALAKSTIDELETSSGTPIS